MRLVTADDLCVAAGAVLTANLPTLIEQLGLDEAHGAVKPYRLPRDGWTQVPTPEALQSANIPAGAITSRGIVGTPRKSSLGIDADWRLIVAVFDRGPDYNQTATRVRTWAALVRGVLLANPTLGGVATGLQWRGESYRQFPQTAVARTLGGCVVEVDVTARNVADLGEALPLVQSSAPSLDVV